MSTINLDTNLNWPLLGRRFTRCQFLQGRLVSNRAGPRLREENDWDYTSTQRVRIAGHERPRRAGCCTEASDGVDLNTAQNSRNCQVATRKGLRYSPTVAIESTESRRLRENDRTTDQTGISRRSSKTRTWSLSPSLSPCRGMYSNINSSDWN